MPKNSIFSFIRSSITSNDTTTFLDLDYSKESSEEMKIDDVSKLEIHKIDYSSPKLEINRDTSPQIPMIGIGGAGMRILDQIVERINGYGMNYPVLGVDTDKSKIGVYDNISHQYHIPGNDLGTSHQYRFAASRVKKAEEQIKSEIEQYLDSLAMVYKHKIVFLLLGAGGTGVGAGIEIARILLEMGKRPVPFLILPSSEEMSRIKFNAAVAMYYFNYAPKDRCLNLTTICIDNELILNHNSKKYYSSVIEALNERIAATIGDLIATTELESHAYSADLNEFLEIFRDLKGIGVLQYMQINDLNNSVLETFEKNLSTSLSLDIDIYTGTRSYFFISSKRYQISAEDYRQLMLRFDNADVFNKLFEVDESVNDDYIAIRGIFTGIQYPNYIEELMQLAEDARVKILNKETENQNVGKVNPKIDKLDGDEELDIKTGQELVEERAEDYAKMRRGEDN